MPKSCSATPQDDVSNIERDMDKMKIAWRYEGLTQVDSTFSSSTNFGHHFDLSKYVDPETVKDCNIRYWTPTNITKVNKGK